MILRSIVLQNFRSYTQAKFDFSEQATVVVGPNTAGKTNLAEAIHMLATGKSAKSPTDISLIHFGKEIGRIKGLVIDEKEDKTTLEVVLMSPQYNNGRFGKKYLVNDVPKGRTHFLGILPLVLFRPEELDIIIDGPSVRRNFLNEVLEQVDREYAASIISYERALRQRNALLRRAQETASNALVARTLYKEQFAYWDALVIEHGHVIHNKRAACISWMNAQVKDVTDFHILYDHSIISAERLQQYQDAEIGAGVTLVGPHRDDFFIEMVQEDGKARDVKLFGSRGQQRLIVLQLKLLQIAYTMEKLGKKPLLVLDDIFSELDTKHITLVLDKISGLQAIITTTHKEFIPKERLQDYSMIEL